MTTATEVRETEPVLQRKFFLREMLKKYLLKIKFYVKILLS
jgi:hypothetical protein